MWALGFEFSGFLLPTVLWLWVIKKESTVAWHWRVLFTYVTAKLVKIVSKKFFNLWKWSREGYAATEKNIHSGKFTKTQQEKWACGIWTKTCSPHPHHPHLHLIQQKGNSGYLMQLGIQGSLSLQLQLEGYFPGRDRPFIILQQPPVAEAKFPKCSRGGGSFL